MYCESNIEQACCVCVDIRDDFYEKTVGNAKLLNDYERKEAPMKYILTYKFSQDHLELFFGAIRSSGGFNINPTAQQFTAACK